MFNNTSQCLELEVRSERPTPASAHSRILILAPTINVPPSACKWKDNEIYSKFNSFNHYDQAPSALSYFRGLSAHPCIGVAAGTRTRLTESDLRFL